MGCGASSDTVLPGLVVHTVGSDALLSQQTDTLGPGGTDATNIPAQATEEATVSGQPEEEVEYQYVPIPKYVDKVVLEFFKGNSRAADGNLEEAIRCFSAAIEEKPDYATAFHQRGLAYVQLFRYDQALQDFDQAIVLNPSYGRAYNSRAAVHLEMKAYSKAVEDATAGVGLSPKDPDGYKIREEAYTQLGDLEKAESDRDAVSQLEGNKLCNVCLSEPRGTRLHPCLHSCMCADCAHTLEEKGFPCPICQEPIAHIEFGIFDQTFAFTTLYSKTAKNPLRSLLDSRGGFSEEETIREMDEGTEERDEETN